MLDGVGGKNIGSTSPVCCDVCCCDSVPYSTLDILKPGYIPRKRKSPPTVRTVDSHVKDTLRERLVKERAKIVRDNPGYAMLGPSFVFSDAVIKQLCTKSEFITSIDFLDDVKGIRLEYKQMLYRIVMEVVDSCPAYMKLKRQRKKS